MIVSINISTYSKQSKFLKEDLEVAVHDASLKIDKEALSNGYIVFDQTAALETFEETLEINTGLREGEDYTITAFEFFDHDTQTSGYACENPANPLYEFNYGSQTFTITCPTILAIISYKSNNYITLPGDSNTGKDIIKGAAYSYEFDPNIQVASANVAGFAASMLHTSNFNTIMPSELIKKGEYYWPVPYTSNITSHFQKNRLNPVTNEIRDHNGTDISANGIENQQAVSIIDGLVTYAGYVRGYGNVVEVTHANNLVTRYAHLNQILVSKGDKVSGGDVVGLIGSTGNSTGPHLHFETIVNGKFIDPLLLFE
ncbi:M23 family metallopeptidase [Oceanobacillus luteolus]|uniref:M23 family metallopeptidase n=1 Tax=Oceanobacillus luteolus TaxID=1274358 RepID=A0ABW4HXC6_9BACI